MNKTRLPARAMTLMYAIFFLLAIASYGQSNETITEYFDKDWNTVTDKTKAAYYRTVEYKDEKILVRDYFISGNIQMFAECSEVSPDLKFQGKAIWYYENGAIKTEGNYERQNKIGVHKTYYENAALQSEVKFTDGKEKYIHFLSPEGKEMLPNGVGTIQNEPTNSSWDNYTVVKDSMVLASYVIEKISRDTVFLMAEKMAEFKGGLPALARYLSGEVSYPRSARRDGTQGTVYVSFQIDKKGTVKDCKVVRGISEECDFEALRVVESMKSNRWIAGKFNGKPVNSRFVLPIKFRLTP